MSGAIRKILAKDLRTGDRVSAMRYPGCVETITLVCTKVLFLNDSFVEVAFVDPSSREIVFEGLYPRAIEVSIF